MKKKICILSLFVIAFLSFLLMGCTANLGKKKPCNFYYTNLLAKNLALEDACKSNLLDTFFYKEKDLSETNIETVQNFLSSLNKANFIPCPENMPPKPLYKLFFNFNKEKFVIDVYNEQFISIYPWDGDFTKDYIDMSGTYNSYNLYGLCKYLIPRE